MWDAGGIRGRTHGGRRDEEGIREALDGGSVVQEKMKETTGFKWRSCEWEEIIFLSFPFISTVNTKLMKNVYTINK